ncbi:MAG: hypothetical protein Q8O67_11260 [Deltaproteobacteria bacterium]|nr:hypothetical protein [Deltaproteobacteria bacterium]
MRCSVLLVLVSGLPVLACAEPIFPVDGNADVLNVSRQPNGEGEGEGEGEASEGEGEGEAACLSAPSAPEQDEGFAGWTVVPGGAFDDAAGWTLGGPVGIADGTARFELAGECTVATLERAITFTDEDLHFRVDIDSELPLGLSLDGVPVTATPTQAAGEYTVCLPDALRGRTAILRFELHGSFDLCADNSIARVAVLDDIAVGRLPRCGERLALVDPGFEHAAGGQPSVGPNNEVQGITSLGDESSDLLGSWFVVRESHGGFGVQDEGCNDSRSVRFDVDSPCDNFSLRTAVVLPPRAVADGLRLRMSASGPLLPGSELAFGLTTLRGGLPNDSIGAQVEALDGGFVGLSVCVPQRFQDAVAQVEIHAGATGGACADFLGARFVVDDVDLVLDPTCE